MTNLPNKVIQDSLPSYFGGVHGMPTRRKLLLKKTIKALETQPIFHGPALALADPTLFKALVAEKAYFKAERRGFEPGYELSDWLDAEKELLAVPSYCLD